MSTDMMTKETWRGTKFPTYELTVPEGEGSMEIFAEADKVEVKREYKADQIMVLDKYTVLEAAEALDDQDKTYLKWDAPKGYYVGCQSLYSLSWAKEIDTDEFLLVPKGLFQKMTAEYLNKRKVSIKSLRESIEAHVDIDWGVLEMLYHAKMEVGPDFLDVKDYLREFEDELEYPGMQLSTSWDLTDEQLGQVLDVMEEGKGNIRLSEAVLQVLKQDKV